MDQDLISNRPPHPPAGRAARATAGTPLIYTYILNGGKELDALEKICPEISQKFENYVANEMVKLLVCSMWGDR